MPSNPVNPFEYVSILVSIILGLGITQLLSAFSDLLYHYQKVKFYWPHTLWVIFILFLHIQDWFIMYQLQTMKVWSLPTMMFILAYPVTLFICAKLLLPTNELEERSDMKKFYFSQFPLFFPLFPSAFCCLFCSMSGCWPGQWPSRAFWWFSCWPRVTWLRQRPSGSGPTNCWRYLSCWGP